MKTLYAVMGNPVEHSLSPVIYKAFAEQFGLEIDCEKIKVSDGEFESVMKDFIARGGRGSGITVPLKTIAYDWAQHASNEASQARAASMIHIDGSGQTVAYNFDGIGLVKDIKNQGRFDFKNKSILICGAGGAAQGAIPAILNEGPMRIALANRTVSKAELLSDIFDHVDASAYEDLKPEYDCVINATTSSLNKIELPLSQEVLAKAELCYDMMYSKTQTAFLQQAKQAGAKKLLDGLGMLVEHCGCAFEVWENKKPDTVSVIKKIRSE